MSTEQQLFEEMFGTAKLGGGDYQKAKKIEKGDTEARLLPPMKSQRSTGQWSVFHRVHYGYYVPNARDANGKPWAKPFLCVEEKDMRTQMVTRECPKCTQVRAQLALREEREAEIKLDLKGRPETEIKAAIKADPSYDTVAKWLRQHNVENAHYINVKYVSGDIGCMKIPGGLKKELVSEIKKLNEKKIDAFAPNGGVFFRFHREGEAILTKYSVGVAKEEFKGPDGGIYERMKTAPLSATDMENIKARAMDLTTAHGASILTEAQIKALVECDEDPSTVETIFGQAQKVTPEEAAVSKVAVSASPAAKQVVQAAAAPKAAPKAASVAAPAPAAEDDEEAALMAALAAARAKKAAAAAKPAPAPKTAPAASLEEMDPDSFIAEFGDPSK